MSLTTSGVRRSLMLLATGALSIAVPAAAQDFEEPSRPANLPPGAVVQQLPTGPNAELRRNLEALNANPRSTSALIGAGRAALEMGDAQAALQFFSRADAESPRDARVKAGMAAALVQLEQPQAAMTLFQEAVSLGAPEVEIAAERGLAHDTLGQPDLAQRDYQLALRRRDDPEVRRRLALSQAISGRREEALRTIDRQLRNNDRAAWRTQAFILAVTGDTVEANRAAASVMPAGMAQAMAPFFARLASLTPAEKAMAVHFGHIPGNGRPATAGTAYADAGSRPLPPAQPAYVPPPARARPDAAAGTAVRREWPDSPIDNAATGPGGRRRFAELDTRRVEPAPRPAEPQPARTVGRFEAVPPSGGAERAASPGFSLTPSGPQPGTAGAGRPSEQAPQPVVQVPVRPFSDIAALVNALPQDEVVNPPIEAQARSAMTDRQIADALARERERASRAANPPARTPASPPVRTAVRNDASAQPRAQQRSPAHPSRHWVQIATVPDEAGLTREFTRLRGRASEQLNGRQIYTAPYGRSSNRLLVGPFDTSRAAQEFVNQLGRASVSAFAWTSEAGQEIERVQTRR